MSLTLVGSASVDRVSRGVAADLASGSAASRPRNQLLNALGITNRGAVAGSESRGAGASGSVVSAAR